MGCGSTKEQIDPIKTNTSIKHLQIVDNNNPDQKKADLLQALNNLSNSTPALTSKRTYTSKYNLFNFKPTSQQSLILYTSPTYQGNEFISLTQTKKERKEQGQFKSSVNGIAVSYNKGFKMENVNQDKFFIILDNNTEIYCLIDGHGPYGHIIGQIIQDKVYTFFGTLFKHENLEENYESIFKTLFEEMNQTILKREIKEYTHYDPFLSGAAVTIVLREGDTLYHANVGNVLAYIFNYDKLCPSKYSLTQLSFNDSNFESKVFENGKDMCFETDPEKTGINYCFNPNDINFEIRRIYENGGETRQLSGESKSRIFIKGKYFPGMIITRTIGDQIGNGIGCICTPHVSKFQLQRDIKYYLLICTDGINNVLNHEKLLNIIQGNEMLLLESITNIVNEARGMFRSHLYSPDMTIVLKELKVGYDG